MFLSLSDTNASHPGQRPSPRRIAGVKAKAVPVLTLLLLLSVGGAGELLAQRPPSAGAGAGGMRPGMRPAMQAAPVQTEPRSVEARTLTSADGAETRIEDVSRIVGLGGAVTETLYALGYGAQVVGSDESSTYPAELFRKPRLSVFRQSTSEGILSLNPTLVVSTAGIRPLTVPQQLRDAGVPVLLLEDAYTPDQAAERIRILGQALQQEELAGELIEAMREDLAVATAEQADAARKPRVLFIYTRGASMVNVAGKGTAAHAVIELAGGENVMGAFDGYRPLTAEAAVSAAPDIILVPERGLQMLGGMDAFLEQPGLALTPAAREGRILAIDDAYLLSFGPRLGRGVLELTRQLAASIEQEN